MKIKYLIKQWPHQECLRDLKIPKYLPSIFQKLSILSVDGSDGNFEIENGLEVCDVKELVSLARSVLKCRPTNEDKEGRMKKRRKLTSSVSSDISEGESDDEGSGIFKSLVTEIEDLGRRHASLFEWSDGPLVHAMKSGQMLLLDEMSLAEDAVLERLNSVLEPSRTLVLAEKGDDGSGTENRIVVADDGFRIFATMNPGGDFGKRELSPALRSRFTEIWVPAVTARADFELVLGRTLVPRNIQISSSKEARVVEAMLTYVEWFNGTICGGKTSPYADFKLTLRDVLSWARFVVEAQKANRDLALWDAYCHGACLMHLDGFGLGAGLAVEDAANVKRRAESFLLSQLPPVTSVSNLGGTKEKFGIRELIGFGAFPFFTHVGPHPVPESRFNLTAPTTALNMFRVLRAMQLSKPVLLEGSPGVGKTR
jgi:midasin